LVDARLVEVLGVEAPEGLGTVVGGLAAKAVLVPLLPQPQLVQLEGDHPQPPVVWQPVEVASRDSPIRPDSTHGESTTRMAGTSLSKSASPQAKQVNSFSLEIGCWANRRPAPWPTCDLIPSSYIGGPSGKIDTIRKVRQDARSGTGW
jgi:hypothetical protein